MKQIEDGKRQKEADAAQRRSEAKATKKGTSSAQQQGDADMSDAEDSDALLDIDERVDGDEAMEDVSPMHLGMRNTSS